MPCRQIMKRLIAIICSLCLLIQPIASLADARELAYGKITSNPNLEFPLHEDAIMKNGKLVIEAEDLQYNPKEMDLLSDPETSGGKYIKSNATNSAYKYIEDISLPDFSITFQNDMQSSTIFYYWFRMSTPVTYQMLSVDYLGNDSWVTAATSLRPSSKDVNKWIWKRLGSTTIISPGVYTTKFARYQGPIAVDKIIITNDGNFTPEGVNPDPFTTGGSVDMSDEGGEANAVNWRDTSKIKVYPEKGMHPKLYMTPKIIEQTKERIEKNELSKASFDSMLKMANRGFPDYSNDDTATYTEYSSCFDICRARAFAYAFGAIDAALAREAVEWYLNGVSFLDYKKYSDSTTASRAAGTALSYGALIYDWAYDLWTEDERQQWIDLAYYLQGLTETGWPPIRRSFYQGHATEMGIFQVALEFAIAIYDEDPSAYDIVAAIIYGPLLETLRHFVKAAHVQQPGSYFSARTGGPMVAEWMLKALGDSNPIADNWSDVFKTKIYRSLPNGIYNREDDDYDWQGYAVDTYHSRYDYKYLYHGYAYDDPVMLRHGLLELAINGSYTPSWEELLYIDFDKISTEDLSTWPLTYFTGEPMTTMAARTNWQWGLNAPTATGYISMREFGASDHGHKDTGGFQIYYKGFLAIDSGYYSYDGGSIHMHNWQDRTIGHNCMLIDNHDPQWYRPSGSLYVNDGGQKRGSRFATYRTPEFMYDPGQTYAYNKAKYAGPNNMTPAFSYISSDISQAYNDTKYKKLKVETDGYERSMVFMDTFNEDYPAAVIVYDNVNALDAGYTKSWLLHSQQEPIIDKEKGTMTIYRNEYGYNGKLVNTTLTPSVNNSEVKVIGGPGREFEVNGVNYPSPVNLQTERGKQRDWGNWTIYLSPKAATKEDKFLNVMYVSDYDKNLPGPQIYKEFGTVYTGATILDRMVTFSLSHENIENKFTLNVRNNGYDIVKCLVTDLATGKWQISGNGISAIVDAKDGENVGYFEVPPGSYSITPVNGGEVTYYDNGPVEKDDFGDFRIIKNNNIMYQPKPGKIINGNPYVAVDGVLTQLANSEITSVSADGRTVSLKSDSHTLVITADADTALYDGKVIPVTKPAKMYNGELYSALDDFTRFFFIRSFKYFEFADALKINVTSTAPLSGIDRNKMLTPVVVSGSPHHGEGFDIEKVYDNDLSTYYCTTGTDKFLIYDFGETKEIERVAIAWYSGSIRQQYFDIYVSDDGVNWSCVLEEGTSSGKTVNFEFFKIKASGRYLKMVSNGNSTSRTGYNSIYELIALTK